MVRIDSVGCQHVCSFEDVIIFYSKEICKAQWLSWLERRPVTAEVVSSSLIWVVHTEGYVR